MGSIVKVCDADELFASLELQEVEGTRPYKVVAATPERTALDKKWQTFVLQDLCDNIIKPNDDEIKDALMKSRKVAQKKELPGIGSRDDAIAKACERTRLCK